MKCVRSLNSDGTTREVRRVSNEEAARLTSDILEYWEYCSKSIWREWRKIRE